LTSIKHSIALCIFLLTCVYSVHTESDKYEYMTEKCNWSCTNNFRPCGQY